jgi:hypothetical protein
MRRMAAYLLVQPGMAGTGTARACLVSQRIRSTEKAIDRFLD